MCSDELTCGSRSKEVSLISHEHQLAKMRNKRFFTREPFHHDDELTLQRAEGPFHFLNPTRAHFSHSAVPASRPPPESYPSAAAPVPAKKIGFLWRSRDNRKGRHPLLFQRPGPGEEALFLTPRQTTHPEEILLGVLKTLLCYPIYDISWLVGFIFTWGSIVWVINGFFVWLPDVDPSTEFAGEVYYGGGVTAFIGAIVFFEFGSILLMLEAINANRSGCFGWAVEQLVEHELANGKARLAMVPSPHRCRHHHRNSRNLVGKPSASSLAEGEQTTVNGKDMQWQWYPSWHELRTHYFHELGFLASSAQLFGATVYSVSGFTALPGIQNHLEPQWRRNAAYWLPQIVGGGGFIVSSTLFMLETQQRWWKPAPHLLGWHVGFWNLIGSLGFTLSGALGLAHKNSGAQYQAGLATFWGSWAFLIGSYLQLYESLNKHPVEESKDIPSSEETLVTAPNHSPPASLEQASLEPASLQPASPQPTPPPSATSTPTSYP